LFYKQPKQASIKEQQRSSHQPEASKRPAFQQPARIPLAMHFIKFATLTLVSLPSALAQLCPAPNTNGYQMCLDLVGIGSVDYTMFTDARSKWTSKITGDLPDVLTKDLSKQSSYTCGRGYYITSVVDDIYMCARYTPIDGVGNVLGQAGPIYVRSSTGLPVTGKMEFDSADVDKLKSNGLLKKVIMHEMGHIVSTFFRMLLLRCRNSLLIFATTKMKLCIGSLWAYLGITGSSSTCT
jgi:hypothetical protein